ncbi:MAG: ATP-dependent helicase RecG, partial [Solirubrobacteraceae bacterium]|nr:ATP-dependent helicase RecG [Solirubrobacteraceae bacterium]
MGPTVFATSTPLTSPPVTKGAATPSVLDATTPTRGEKAQKAAEALQIDTIGGLLHHLPRGRREAQTIATLTTEDTATVVVEVKSITSRPVRRRGMKPLVSAVVADGTGIMEATFFNQPWLANRYRPGTKLILTGKYQARNRFRVSGHALTQGDVGAEVSTYPATEGLTSDQ